MVERLVALFEVMVRQVMACRTTIAVLLPLVNELVDRY
jgi:hypothetical protein